MDDRELIAEAIWHGSGFSEETEGMPFRDRPERIRHHYLRKADAVLLVIGARLVPDMTEVYAINGLRDPDTRHCLVGLGGHAIGLLHGEGHDFADAMRNALA